MKKTLIIILTLLLLASCTQIIEIDLNSSNPQIVVEGNISTNNDACSVKLTKSINFDKENEFPFIENASVEITDDEGNKTILEEKTPGIYTSSTLRGREGKTYYLNIQKDGKILKSTSTIPNKVKFDSLTIEKSVGMGGFGGNVQNVNYGIFVNFVDPQNETNYYRFLEIINGKTAKSYIFDDRLTNGSNTKKSLIRFGRELKNGDKLEIIMQCVDKNVYNYFNSFGNLMGGPGNSSSPANPYTNIEGGVLGFFNAHTTETIQVIIGD